MMMNILHYIHCESGNVNKWLSCAVKYVQCTENRFCIHTNFFLVILFVVSILRTRPGIL